MERTPETIAVWAEALGVLDRALTYREYKWPPSQPPLPPATFEAICALFETKASAHGPTPAVPRNNIAEFWVGWSRALSGKPLKDALSGGPLVGHPLSEKQARYVMWLDPHRGPVGKYTSKKSWPAVWECADLVRAIVRETADPAPYEQAKQELEVFLADLSRVSNATERHVRSRSEISESSGFGYFVHSEVHLSLHHPVEIHFPTRFSIAGLYVYEPTRVFLPSECLDVAWLHIEGDTIRRMPTRYLEAEMAFFIDVETTFGFPFTHAFHHLEFVRCKNVRFDGELHADSYLRLEDMDGEIELPPDMDTPFSWSVRKTRESVTPPSLEGGV